MTTMDGFINLNKPAGWTSHDCVAKVRRLLKMKRVGHGGTLDPAATGVLPIAIGRATRLLQFLPNDKAYQATIRFGLKTTTDDLEGDILESSPCPNLQPSQVTGLLPQFQGKVQQIPPKYSAIQVGGKRLYELARSGVEVEVPVRTVDIYQIDVLAWHPGDFPELKVAIACGSGTYIRAIARDLGDMVGTGATLAQLIRTDSSGFTLVNSITLDDLADPLGEISALLVSPKDALQRLPLVMATPSQEASWLKGQAIAVPNDYLFKAKPQPKPSADLDLTDLSRQSLAFVRVCNNTDHFLGVGYQHFEKNSAQPDEHGSCIIHPKVVFN